MMRKVNKNNTRRKLLSKNKKNNSSKIMTENKWIFVADSVIGRSHITSGTPCQDSYYISYFSSIPNWGIAVVCDGAGSAEYSHLGSDFISKKAIPTYFEKEIKAKGWHSKSELPSEEEWSSFAKEGLINAYSSLNYYSENNLNIPLKTLACTVIVVIFSPHGLLVTHIGDGRAGYCSSSGEWVSMMSPHKGEEANMTYFITSSAWLTSNDCITSNNIAIPESRVINDQVKAFVLLSDGMESHCFQCSTFDNDTSKWTDLNIPYAPFFNPLLKYILQKENTSELKDEWDKFLTDGTEGIRNELDDKTMILCVSKEIK